MTEPMQESDIEPPIIVQGYAYDETGRIRRTFMLEKGHETTGRPTDQTICYGTADIDRHYFDLSARELREKQPLDLTLSKYEIRSNGNDVAVISGLPIPATVLIDNQTVAVEDGSLEFTAISPGLYCIMIDEPAYIREEIFIHAI